MPHPSNDTPIQTLKRSVIAHLLKKLESEGFQVALHFELEGMVQCTQQEKLDFKAINLALQRFNISGELKPEYWPGQWEYVSIMSGQNPLQEADYLQQAITLLPSLLRKHGANKVFLTPVVWQGSNERYLPESTYIFAKHTGAVHVPNAVQVNVSILDSHGKNLMPESVIAEWLQHHLLETSYTCCLLFLPDEDAFERIRLRTEYGMDAELSSPFDLSGGHQGSIALYRELGKHNQHLGLTPLVVDAKQQPLIHSVDWHATARIEHRLGATCERYDPYINVIYVLLNVFEAIRSIRKTTEAPPVWKNRPLPASLNDTEIAPGAISLYRNDNWFAESLNLLCGSDLKYAGTRIKESFLQQFRRQILSEHMEPQHQPGT